MSMMDEGKRTTQSSPRPTPPSSAFVYENTPSLLLVGGNGSRSGVIFVDPHTNQVFMHHHHDSDGRIKHDHDGSDPFYHDATRPGPKVNAMLPAQQEELVHKKLVAVLTFLVVGAVLAEMMFLVGLYGSSTRRASRTKVLRDARRVKGDVDDGDGGLVLTQLPQRRAERRQVVFESGLERPQRARIL